jgi:nitric oxide reductase NorQ protein
VVIHPLADHRRELNIERIGESLAAPKEFMLVLSYNPGYQSVLKDLKPSTRQRMVAIELNYPNAAIEERIVMQESQIDSEQARRLVRLGQAIRALQHDGLPEGASTRTLIATACLIKSGLAPSVAANAAIVGPLSDDPDAARKLREMTNVYMSS